MIRRKALRPRAWPSRRRPLRATTRHTCAACAKGSCVAASDSTGRRGAARGGSPSHRGSTRSDCATIWARQQPGRRSKKTSRGRETRPQGGRGLRGSPGAALARVPRRQGRSPRLLWLRHLRPVASRRARRGRRGELGRAAERRAGSGAPRHAGLGRGRRSLRAVLPRGLRRVVAAGEQGRIRASVFRVGSCGASREREVQRPAARPRPRRRSPDRSQRRRDGGARAAATASLARSAATTAHIPQPMLKTSHISAAPTSPARAIRPKTGGDGERRGDLIADAASRCGGG